MTTITQRIVQSPRTPEALEVDVASGLFSQFVGRVLVFLLLLVSCTRTQQREAPAKAETKDPVPALIGYWVTESRPTQLGRGKDELCLRTDGIYERVFRSEGATLVDSGR